MIERAILLAAGEGRRLRPLTEVLPKCLVPVHGRPLLGFWIERLAAAGIAEVLVNLCYLGDRVESYLRGRDWPCRLRMVREPALRGTGGTLIDALPFWRDRGVLLLHADNLGDIDLAALLAAHAARPPHWLATLASFDTEVPRECGIVEAAADGTVTAFHEKVPDPPGRRASAAVFALDAALAAHLPPRSEAALDFSAGLLPGLVGRLGTFHHAGFHRDIGAGGRYLRAQWEFPGCAGAPDAAWTALLASAGGALREGLVAALAQTARDAGWQPQVFADAAAALAAPITADRLAIVLKARAGESSTGMFRATGLRSVVLEMEV